MLKKPWIFLTNPFLSVLADSFSKVVQLSTFHDSRLAAATNATLVSIYAAYHPIHLVLLAAYSSWQQHKGIQKGTTAGAAQTRKQITDKVNEWDRAIQQVFVPGTPDYVKLFPDGHKPFQHGKQQEILSAVKGLSDTLGTYTQLSTVKTNVDAYYTQLDNTNTDKNTAKAIRINMALRSKRRLPLPAARCSLTSATSTGILWMICNRVRNTLT